MAVSQIGGAAPQHTESTPLRRMLAPEWRLAREYRLWRPYLRGTLGSYYLDWTPGGGMFGEDWRLSGRDSAGVLFSAASHTYHPVRIAQYALYEHANYLKTGAAAAREAFLTQACWLRDEVSASERGALQIPSAWPKFGADAGYISAKAQGEAISVLLRAHEAKPQEGFLEAAICAAEPFSRTVEDGGVVWRGSGGDTFLEEIATLPAAHVLGGCVLGFWGLFELQRFANPRWLGEVLGSTVATLQRRLGYFDSGYWSYESALEARNGYRPVATLRVHDFHIALLRVCSSMTADPYFDAIADAWTGHVADARCRRRVLANVSMGLVSQPLRGASSVASGARSIF